MTTYAFLSITPASSTWTLVSNTKTFVSPLTGATQTAQRNGTRWLVTLEFVNLSGADRQLMQGWLAQLDGQRHRFTLHDHAYTARGALGGTPTVNGASQTGNSIVTAGWPNSTAILKQGDQISLDGELKMVTADVTSSGAGAATIAFVPEIHTSPANGSSIVTASPTGIFMLLTAEASWNNRPGIFSDFTIQAVEDVLA